MKQEEGNCTYRVDDTLSEHWLLSEGHAPRSMVGRRPRCLGEDWSLLFDLDNLALETIKIVGTLCVFMCSDEAMVQTLIK